jgi:hypothetical protein
VLGKHWRGASTAERQDFVDAFEEMNTRQFLAMKCSRSSKFRRTLPSLVYLWSALR